MNQQEFEPVSAGDVTPAAVAARDAALAAAETVPPVRVVDLTAVMPVIEWREPWWRRVLTRVKGVRRGRA